MINNTLSRKYIILLSALSTILFSLDDFLQQWLSDASNHAEIEWNFVVSLYVLSLCMWASGLRWLNLTIIIIFGLFSAIQLGNIAYFGQPLNPADLPNLFSDAGEVWQTGAASFGDHWIVLVCVLVPFVSLYWLHSKFCFEVSTTWRVVSVVLIVAILGSKPLRATERSMSFFMAGPTRSSMHNSLNAWSFFLTHINNSDTTLQGEQWLPYRFSYTPSATQHVWLIVVDSLPSYRMGAYGYPRDNTPHLSKLVYEGKLIAKKGIAAGVSTIVSLSNMINLAREPGQQDLLSNHVNNIYKHAKHQGFKTLWLSSQESKLMSFLGARFIDVKTTREDHPVLFAQQGDLGLLDIIEQQDWQHSSFAIINLRTVHSPYSANYQGLLDNPPWPDTKDLTRFDRENNAYDNALVLLDQNLEQIIETFDQLPGEGYLVITSDHGQFLGQDNRWGHNKLEPEVIDVPILLHSKHASSDKLEAFQKMDYLSHYQMMVLLANTMGILIDNPNDDGNTHFVKGSKILGNNMVRRVSTDNASLHYGETKLTQEWLAEKP